MKLKNVSNIDGLFDVIKQCNGRVDIVTDDMVLNLKSEIARYFVVSQALSDGVIREIELVVFNQEDRANILDFMNDEVNKI